MSRHIGADAIYDAADLFRQSYIREGKCVLWPDQSWDDGIFNNVVDLLRVQVEIGKVSGIAENLLQYEPLHTMIVTDLLIFSTLHTTAKNKLSNLEIMLDSRSDLPPVDEPAFARIKNAFESGIPTTTAFETRRGYELLFTARVFQQARLSGIDPHDAKSMCDILDEIRQPGRYPISYLMIPHLLFPDEIENMPYWAHREWIINTFADEKVDLYKESLWSLEQRLIPIKAKLSADYPEGEFSFYLPEIREQWLHKPEPKVDPEVGDLIPQEELDDSHVGYAEPPFDEIVTAVARTGLKIDARTLRRYHLSLRTRKFVILSGPSGTGKTWLATAWAEAAGARSLVTPVAPNWTTNEDLLGYLSPLTDSYIDTDFSRFLRQAAAEQAKADAAGVLATPYHLVLDEMNLARVEYYFARFLSAMERRVRGEAATIELGTESLPLPENLVVIGTVNIDETTHGFADKVYDRAQLIELGIDRAQLAAYLVDQPFATALLEAWDCVATVKPFAFRIAREFIAYIGDAEQHGIDWGEAFDEQMMQKVLPRLTGTDPQLIKALEALQTWSAGRYPLSHARISQMLDRSRHTGIVSYFG